MGPVQGVVVTRRAPSQCHQQPGSVLQTASAALAHTEGSLEVGPHERDQSRVYIHVPVVPVYPPAVATARGSISSASAHHRLTDLFEQGLRPRPVRRAAERYDQSRVSRGCTRRAGDADAIAAQEEAAETTNNQLDRDWVLDVVRLDGQGLFYMPSCTESRSTPQSRSVGEPQYASSELKNDREVVLTSGLPEGWEDKVFRVGWDDDLQ